MVHAVVSVGAIKTGWKSSNFHVVLKDLERSGERFVSLILRSTLLKGCILAGVIQLEKTANAHSGFH